MAKKDPKESRPLMLRRSQWDMLRELAKAHWTTWALSAAAAKITLGLAKFTRRP